MKKVLMLGLLIGLVVPGLRGGKHPVPLDAETDAAKCVECHEPHSRMDSVHAVACTKCHKGTAEAQEKENNLC